MTDLELTKLCAEAMGWSVTEHPTIGKVHFDLRELGHFFDPLNEDAQAFALDAFILESGYCIYMTSGSCDILPLDNNKASFHWVNPSPNADMTKAENRRRIRVEAVAQIQAVKS